jgi:hypothetical protein
MPVLAFRLSTPSLLSICGGCPGSAILPSAMMSPSGAESSAHGRYGESTRPRCSPRYQRIKVSFLPNMYWDYMLKGYEWFPKHNTAFKEPTVR